MQPARDKAGTGMAEAASTWPLRIFDAHLHIIDPRFPVVANQGYLPPAFTVEDYRARTATLGIAGGAVVSASFQATDQSYLRDALRGLGPAFVGVTQLPDDVSAGELHELDAIGVRAVRLNLYRGRSRTAADVARIAQTVFDTCGWHTEIYLDGSQLAEFEPWLSRLPKLVVDHLGMTAAGLPALRRLLAAGAVTKATGFGRVEMNVPNALRSLVDTNPTGLVFATDLPSTRARRPFQDEDVDLVTETLGAEMAGAVFWDNAVRLYRPRQSDD